MVITTRPVRSIPVNAALVDLLAYGRSPTRSTAAVSMTARLPGAPSARVGTGRPNTCAGMVLMRSTRSESGMRPPSTSSVLHAAKAVSSPITPKGAAAKGFSFSSAGCGA